MDGEKNWLVNFIFRNGAFAIDSWFFISGVLLTQLFFKSSRDFGISNERSISRHFEHCFFLFAYKIVQILLPLYVTSKILLVSMKHFHENSILSIPSNDHLTCEKNVLTMLFNTYIPYERRVINLKLNSNQIY